MSHSVARALHRQFIVLYLCEDIHFKHHNLVGMMDPS